MTRWETKAPQIAACDLCGRYVDNRRLMSPDVEGLRGFDICSTHRFERAAAAHPSYGDLKAFSMPASAPEAGTITEPLGLAIWYEDPESE